MVEASIMLPVVGSREPTRQALAPHRRHRCGIDGSPVYTLLSRRVATDRFQIRHRPFSLTAGERVFMPLCGPLHPPARSA